MKPFTLLATLSGLCVVALAANTTRAGQPLGQGAPATAAEEQRLQERYSAYRAVDADYRHAGEQTVENWMDWKWGLRIHWGLYCMYDCDESWILVRPQRKSQEWQQEYYTSYQRFNPTNFNADEWMQMLQRAGMKYFSFTSKHHEGFCLWPTRTLQRGFRRNADGSYTEVTNHFSVAESPYGKDIIGQLVRSARAHDLGVSLYYSHIDWHDWDFGWDKRNFWYDPGFTPASQPARWAAYMQKEREQLEELLTSYGPLDTLCLDGDWPDAAMPEAHALAKWMRSVQPNVMLRNRGIDAYGDYETPEGQIPANPNNVKRPWQVIYPGGQSFSYRSQDKFKPREWLLESLIDIVAKGGNFQIGYGPDPSGKWQPEVIDRISYVGDWLKVNSECIFATRPYLRYHEGPAVRFTRTKDKKYVYLICLKWPGTTLTSTLVHAKAGSPIRMLGSARDLVWRQEAKGLTIELPPELQSEATRLCSQAWAFKVESEDWDKFADSLPQLAPLPAPRTQQSFLGNGGK